MVKGFLNLVISDGYYLDFFNSIKEETSFGYQTPASKDAVMVEYSSPNTNKPLHLGHIRNNLLGYAVAEILKAAGHKVYKTQIVNDRGIHICKSMLAWQRFGDERLLRITGWPLHQASRLRFKSQWHRHGHRVDHIEPQHL